MNARRKITIRVTIAAMISRQQTTQFFGHCARLVLLTVCSRPGEPVIVDLDPRLINTNY